MKLEMVPVWTESFSSKATLESVRVNVTISN